jgi:hypothetical protein
VEVEDMRGYEMPARWRAASALVWCSLGFAALLPVQPLAASPVELLRRVAIAPGDADRIALSYANGGGGLFVSVTGPGDLGLVCASAIDPALEARALLVHESGSRELFIGTASGLWRGDAQGCGFTPVPELTGHFIAALAADPVQPARTYLATADHESGENGLYVTDGPSAAFRRQGSLARRYIESLLIVRRGDGDARRFYEIAVDSASPAGAAPQFYVRVSDDEGVTWSEHGFAFDAFPPVSRYPDLSLLAVDPADPAHIVARIQRDIGADTLVHSTQQGEPGTWQRIADVGELSGAEFTADGRLFYGDHAPSTRGLYVVQEQADTVQQLTDSWNVACLRYAAEPARLYGCSDVSFGTVDLATGELTPVFDLRCAQRFIDCPGQPEVALACAEQLYPGNYCDAAHYPAAAVCRTYAASDPASHPMALRLDYSCEGGLAHSRPDAGSAQDAMPLEVSSSRGFTTQSHMRGGCAVVMQSASAVRHGTLFSLSLLLLASLRTWQRKRVRSRASQRERAGGAKTHVMRVVRAEPAVYSKHEQSPRDGT